MIMKDSNNITIKNPKLILTQTIIITAIDNNRVNKRQVKFNNNKKIISLVSNNYHSKKVQIRVIIIVIVKIKIMITMKMKIIQTMKIMSKMKREKIKIKNKKIMNKMKKRITKKKINNNMMIMNLKKKIDCLKKKFHSNYIIIAKIKIIF